MSARHPLIGKLLRWDTEDGDKYTVSRFTEDLGNGYFLAERLCQHHGEPLGTWPDRCHRHCRMGRSERVARSRQLSTGHVMKATLGERYDDFMDEYGERVVVGAIVVAVISYGISLLIL